MRAEEGGVQLQDAGGGSAEDREDGKNRNSKQKDCLASKDIANLGVDGEEAWAVCKCQGKPAAKGPGVSSLPV
jgi:hypothetical protein